LDYAIVAEGLNFPEGPVVLDDGSLIVCEVAGGRLMRVARDGRLSVFAETGGSPSGLAVGPDGALYCCNNGGFDWDSAARVPTRTRPLPDASRTSGGGMIQRIDPSTGRVETWLDRFEGRRLAGPNDLQFTADGGFWFSDFGGWVDDGLRHGGLYRVEPDGSARRPNFGLCINGVGVSPDGGTVYGAATYERWVLEFDASPNAGEQPGTVIADCPGRQFLDSLAMEADGTVAVAAFNENPGILRVNRATGLRELVPTPDPITTNIAFGGADMRDAYLTFSHGGTVARCRWPAPGLRLPFNL
jgi:gluconolactonase